MPPKKRARKSGAHKSDEDSQLNPAPPKKRARISETHESDEDSKSSNLRPKRKRAAACRAEKFDEDSQLNPTPPKKRARTSGAHKSDEDSQLNPTPPKKQARISKAQESDEDSQSNLRSKIKRAAACRAKKADKSSQLNPMPIIKKALICKAEKPEKSSKSPSSSRKRVTFSEYVQVKVRSPSPHHDPIGRHLIALRTFYRGLTNRWPKKKKILTAQSIPRFPELYPFSKHLRKLFIKNGNKRQLLPEKSLSKEEVKEMTTLAIKQILLQIGYNDKNMEDIHDKESPLALLSHATDIFLESFVDRLRYHKTENFAEAPDLWDSLETTLQEWGFHGIHGLGKYFYQQFVAMHDSVYNECRQKVAEKLSEMSQEHEQKICKEGNDQISVNETDSVMNVGSTYGEVEEELPDMNEVRYEDSTNQISEDDDDDALEKMWAEARNIV